MPTLYKVPLEVNRNVLAFDMVEAIERHDVKIDYPEDVNTVHVTGTLKELANFFRYLAGSSQSFPISEFEEWASEYEVDENGKPV